MVGNNEKELRVVNLWGMSLGGGKGWGHRLLIFPFSCIVRIDF